MWLLIKLSDTLCSLSLTISYAGPSAWRWQKLVARVMIWKDRDRDSNEAGNETPLKNCPGPIRIVGRWKQFYICTYVSFGGIN